MAYPWTQELYDAPYVYEFFGTTKQRAADRHIVGMKLSTTTS